MRYLTVRVRATERGAFHPLGTTLAEEPAITREALHHVELLDDDTVLTLGEGSGDRARYEAIMAASPHVVDFLVSGEERWMATSQFEAHETVRRLLEWRRASDLVVETPIKINADGSLRMTFLGSESNFQDLYEKTTNSDAFAVEVVETGPYEPDMASFVRALTTRQQEVLQAAVEVGYYENPRTGTHEDVAAAVGIAPTTAGDHLREIETRVFGTLVR
jgi:hypothetical protein